MNVEKLRMIYKEEGVAYLKKKLSNLMLGNPATMRSLITALSKCQPDL
jgi:hypothetical protein